MGGRVSLEGLAEFPPPALDLRPIYLWLPLAGHVKHLRRCSRSLRHARVLRVEKFASHKVFLTAL